MQSKGKLLAYLTALGVNPTMETIDDRKRMQKLVFLLPKFGIDIRFKFNWYIHGPYSPVLTDILYDIVRGQGIYPDSLNQQELGRVKKMKAFLGEDVRSADELELLASIEFLSDVAGGLKDQNAQREIVAFLQRTKPYFTHAKVMTAMEKARQLEELS